MMDGSIGQVVFDSLLRTLGAFTASYYKMFASGFGGVFRALLTLYIIGIGYGLLTNNLGERTKTAFISVVVIFFCFQLVFDSGAYAEWVYKPLKYSSLGMTSMVLNPEGSGTVADIFAKVDGGFSKIFLIADRLSNDSGVLSVVALKTAILTLLLSLLFGALYAVFTGLLLVGMFAFHVMMVFGGIAILLAGFPFTRQVFWAWLRAVFNYALIPVFTAIVMAITLHALDDAAVSLCGNVADMSTCKYDVDTRGVFNKDIGTVFLIGIMSIWFHLKAPEFASLITGSMSQGSGFFGTLAGIAAGGTALARGAINAPRAAGTFAGNFGHGFDALSRGWQAAGRAYSRLRGFKVD
jgi:type IV secretory pathway VirB6-like protein